MAQIVSKRSSLGELRGKAAPKQRLIDQQIVSDCPGDLRSFDTVGQARTIEIRLADAENLRFSLQPAKRSAMQDSVAISLCRVSMILGGSRIFVVSTLQQKIIHGFLYAMQGPGAPYKS
jgi:hypothetical protein